MGQTLGFERGYGKRIALTRKANKFTQITFAKAIGVHPITVAYWEKERHTPSAYLFKIAEALHVSPMWIMTGVEISAVEALADGVQHISAQMPELQTRFEEIKRLNPRATAGDLERVAHTSLDTTEHNGTASEHDPPMRLAEITPARGRGGGDFEFSLRPLTEREAVAGLQWLRGRMLDMPRESDAWPALQMISRELGRLCDPRLRQAHGEESRRGEDSADARMLPDATVEVRAGKSR